MQETTIETQGELSWKDKRENPGVKNCKTCWTHFEINEEEKELQSKFQEWEIETCPECKRKELLAFWPSIWKWYKRKCDFSGEMIVTNYPTDARFPVYKYKYFHSDKWDTPSMDIDFDKNLFQQLQNLQEKTPRPHMLGLNNENCDYCDDAWNSKNCYLSLSMLECELIFYSYRNISCSHSSDIVFCDKCENCHDLTLSSNCYKVFYSVDVKDSADSMFLYNCRDVKNCFMCWNLRNKKYCILNKQYTKDEYEAKLQEYNLWSRKQIKELKKEFNKYLKKQSYFTEDSNISCENVSWNFLSNCKNCENCFLLEESEDCKHILRWHKNTNCLYATGLLEWKNCYMVCQSGYVYNLKYSSYCQHCENSEYLDNCENCKNCFACVWLKNKEYCILNKQYTKEEYTTLVTQIKEKMVKDNELWKMIPYSMTYSGYNTTLARIYFPDTEENIKKLGWYWETEEDITNTTSSYKLADDIKDIADDIQNKAIICQKTWKAFNFTKQMVDLHKENNIPLPDVSHIERMIENYKILWYIKVQKSKCSESGKDITHYYPTELGYENIVSKEIYNKKVY